MNTEYRISNIEVIQDTNFELLIRYVLSSIQNSPSWMGIKGWVDVHFRLIALLILPSFISVALINDLTAQSVQRIYSGLENATSLSVTQNSIYVVEQGKDQLLKLDYEGNIQESIGGRGSGDYEFSRPVDVDATNGLKIFVTDYNNRRVQVFDRRGQHLGSISGRSAFGQERRFIPSHIAMNELGEVFFVDENRRSILHFGQDYNLMDEFRLSTEIRNTDGFQLRGTEIFILDKASGVIHRISTNGSYLGFYPATGVQAFYISTRGVWMGYPNRVQLDDRSQNPRTIELDEMVYPVDIYEGDKNLFILTGNALYKFPIEEL